MGREYHVVTVSIPSGSSISSETDLGRPFNNIKMSIGALSATTLHMLAAEKKGGTYRTLYSSGTAIFQVSTAVSGAVVPAPGADRFIKIKANANLTDGADIHVMCTDD